MIWLLLANYFLGCGLGGVQGSLLTTSAVREWSHRAEIVIAEPERAKAAKKIFAELRKATGRFERKFGRTGWQLNRYYKRYEANDEEVLATLSEFNDEWETMQRRAIELRFRLREQVTEPEWAEFFAEGAAAKSTQSTKY